MWRSSVGLALCRASCARSRRPRADARGWCSSRGEAGIGKTTLVSEAAARSGWAVGWGTCADAERAPAFWAWSTALRGLLDATGPVVTEDGAELARLLPELSGQAAGEAPPEPGAGAADPVALPEPGTVPVAADPVDTEAARLRLFDAVARFLERLACRAPAFVVLDDLQWADASTLDLLRFVARPYRPVPLVIVGAYRPDELAEPEEFVELAARADTVRLSGLTADEVTALVTDVAGDAAADTWAAEVHRRTDGHPFFARQLTELLVGAGPAAAVPGAVRDVVDRRVRRLSAECRALVEAAAVAGNDLMPDVLADVAGHDAATVTRLMEEGVQAGVLVRGADGTRLAHDLFRETVAAGLDVPRRLRLHQQIADALEQRRARGAAVAAADLARHTAAAAPLEGSDRAVGWARARGPRRLRPPGLRGGGRPPRQGPARRRGQRGAGRGRAARRPARRGGRRPRPNGRPRPGADVARRRPRPRVRLRGRRAARPGRVGGAAARRPVRDAP